MNIGICMYVRYTFWSNHNLKKNYVAFFVDGGLKSMYFFGKKTYCIKPTSPKQNLQDILSTLGFDEKIYLIHVCELLY